MADSVANSTVTMARNLAIAQLIAGFLLLSFGFGERVLEEIVSRDLNGGIWAGISVSRIEGPLNVKLIFCTQGLVFV